MSAQGAPVSNLKLAIWFYLGMVFFLAGFCSVPMSVMGTLRDLPGTKYALLIAVVSSILSMLCMAVTIYFGMRIWRSTYQRSPYAALQLSSGGLIVLAAGGMCLTFFGLVVYMVQWTSGATLPARAGSCVQQIRTYSSAVDLYLLDNGVYPTTPQGLNALVALPTTGPMPVNWRGPYIEPAVIRTDPWGSAYVYRCPGIVKTNSYEIVSPGPNKILGDRDDIGN